MRTLLLAVVLTALNTPGGNVTTISHGVEVTDGSINAPLTCDNNSSLEAVVYYNHHIYKCPHWAITEVQ